jgi:hypothetical protein
MGTITENDDEQPGESTEKVVTAPEDQPPAEPEAEVIEDTGGQDERPNAEAADEDDSGDEDHPRRQRETAAQRRERAKKARDRDRREIDFQKREMDRLARDLNELRRAQAGSVVTDLDERVVAANAEAEQFDRIRAAAISKGAGADAVAAENLRDQARQRAWQAAQQRDHIVNAFNRPPPPPPVPYADQAQEFLNAHPWYNGASNDADSLTVKELDRRVAQDYAPTSPLYWSTLEKLVRKNLPHRFGGANADEGDDEAPRTQRRSGPPVGGSSRNTSATSSGTQYRLSPERVNALKEAGLWDDPKTRLRMAKRYAEQDKLTRG